MILRSNLPKGIVDATRLVGIQVDDMVGEIEGSIPSARIQDARRPPSKLAQRRTPSIKFELSLDADPSTPRPIGEPAASKLLGAALSRGEHHV
jgi:hypothetical protein